MVAPLQKRGPLYHASRFKDTKDPCPVFDGTVWHIFGSGGSVTDERWKILHAIAPDLEGPWVEEDPVELIGLSGDHVAAPGVLFDKNTQEFHMFVQTDFLATNGTVEYLTSRDAKRFTKIATALYSIPGTEEAGIYDPHPSVIAGEKYLVYSGTPRVEHRESHFVSTPDVFLAQSESGTWKGPWKRLGKILDHSAIAAHHNQKDHPGYEWGIEGPQLIELPNRSVLLNATCFLPYGRFGTRQRTFFAIARNVKGPYTSLGPILEKQLEEWESGENGHAAGILEGSQLHLFYQARSQSRAEAHANDWRYGIATFDITSLIGGKRSPIQLPHIHWRAILPRRLLPFVWRIIKTTIQLGKKRASKA